MAPLKKAHERLEKEISAAQTKLLEFDKELSAPDLFAKDPERAVKLGQDRAATERSIEALEVKWLDALDAYETACAAEGI